MRPEDGTIICWIVIIHRAPYVKTKYGWNARRGLESEAGCVQTLQLIASVRGAIDSLMAEVAENHMRVHVVDPARERNGCPWRS